MSFATYLAAEEKVAVEAVLRACEITRKVQSELVIDETVEKPDKSPVTVADFASQSIIAHLLQTAFPSDPLVGEEDTSTLRTPASATLRSKIVSLVNKALTIPIESQEGRKSLSEEEVLGAIDRGSYEGGDKGRWWTCDPIDGTLGFLRGEQYAVCLTFLVDAIPVLGLIACPNLSYPTLTTPESSGSLFIAKKGHGAFHRSLAPNSPYVPISLPSSPSSPYSILESVEASHSSHSINSLIGASLGLGERVRMDSQAKYAALSRGEGNIYLRVPTKYSGGKAYQEKIWDHASGVVIVEEAGGVVTDIWGKRLNFGVGRTLKDNEGIVASAKGIHTQVVEAVKNAIEQEMKQGTKPNAHD